MSVANYIASWISLAGLSWIILWLWRDYCGDRYRERLFILRERLFDLAADQVGGLTFESAGYNRLRTTLNGQIRFAGQVDLVGGLVGAMFLSSVSARISREFEREWIRTLSELPEQGAVEITELREQMHRETLRHVLLCSPIATVFFIPAAIVVATLALVKNAIVAGAWRIGFTMLRNTAERFRSAADAAAFDEGCLA